MNSNSENPIVGARFQKEVADWFQGKTMIRQLNSQMRLMQNSIESAGEYGKKRHKYKL